MRIVVDASVALKWLIAERDERAAANLLEGDDELHAPRQLASELANTLRRKAALNEISPVQAYSASAAIPHLPLIWGEDELDAQLAARIALDLDCPVYDCLYLAMALRLGGVMVTADRRFAELNRATPNSRFVATLDQFGA